MKSSNALICLALAFSFAFSGCQSEGKKTNYFKEYTFSARATAKQISDIQKGLSESVSKLSSITRKNEVYEKSALFETNQSSEIKTKILEDNSNKDLFVLEASGTSNSSENNKGIKLKETTRSESKEWDTGSGYIISTSKSTSNKNTEENAYATEQTKTSKDYKEYRINNLLSFPTTSNGTFYINEDGTYTCMTSNISRSVSAVEWGTSTKEYVTASKSQRVYLISKEYHLISYYSYDETSTNRDRSTGEWYNSERLVSYSYSSIKYEYGNRTTADVKQLTQETASKNSLVLSASVRNYETLASLTDNVYTISDSTPTERELTLSSQTTSDGKRRYLFNTNMTYYSSYSSNTYRAQKYEITITTISTSGEKATKNYPVMFDKSVISAPNTSLYTLVTTTNPNATYIVNTSSYYLYLSFTILFANNTVTVESCTINV